MGLYQGTTSVVPKGAIRIACFSSCRRLFGWRQGTYENCLSGETSIYHERDVLALAARISCEEPANPLEAPVSRLHGRRRSA